MTEANSQVVRSFRRGVKNASTFDDKNLKLLLRFFEDVKLIFTNAENEDVKTANMFKYYAFLEVFEL